MHFFFILCLLILATITTSAWADNTTPASIDAESIRYYKNNETIIADGTVKVMQGTHIILADKIIYDIEENSVWAIGNVSRVDPNGEAVFISEVPITGAMKQAIIARLKEKMSGKMLAAFRPPVRKESNPEQIVPSSQIMSEGTGTPPPLAEPQPIKGLEYAGISITGYLDGTYSALTGSGKYAGTSRGNDHVFDVSNKTPLLNAVNLTLSKLPSEGLGGLLDLTAGRDADTIASYGTIDKRKGPANGANHLFDVTEAYLNYGHGPMTFMAGKYVTLAGAEFIKNPSNTTISHSILFGYAIPYSHTGFRMSYKINDSFSVMAGINQGWDDVKDTNSSKTGEFNVTYTPNKKTSITVQDYIGREQSSNFPLSPLSGMRNLTDIVSNYTVTDKLSFILNSDYGWQENVVLPSGRIGTAHWEGIAAYVNYQPVEQWRSSLRAEVFNDKDGYRTSMAAGKTTGQIQKEVTFTESYLPLKSTEIRGEVRHDFSNEAVFGYTDGTAKKYQNSAAIEAIYKF